jgi:cell wall-associated NlpC family hydrolase
MAKGMVVVNEAVGELRRQPDHAAEQVSQVVLGAPLKVLGTRDAGRWRRIESPDGYRGWIRSWSVHPMSIREAREYRNGPLVEVDVLVAGIYERATARSRVIRQAPFGAVLRRVGRSGSWIRVELPDGEKGYLHARKLLVDRKTFRARQRARDIPSVLRTALRFLGVPYQWGGVTAKGIDCSGFTQTVFRAHGVELPRDSRDQFRWAQRETYLQREPVDIQFGHLVFFGEADARISHVGISLGDGEFIHARGRVRIDSLRPEAPGFERELYRIFRGASPVLLQ